MKICDKKLSNSSNSSAANRSLLWTPNGLSVPQPADSIQICPRHPMSEELCVLTKSAEDDHIKSKIDAALSQKDVRALCQLMQADAAAPAFDVDVQVDNLIVSQSLPCSTQPSDLVA